jgi:hypothetical protein
MATVSEERKTGVGDAAVQAATGRTWTEWFALLDAAGSQALDHKGIVARVAAMEPAPSGWWCQMVTVGYEQARGKRQLHETTQGYQVSASVTVAAPLAALYVAWADESVRARWLGEAPLTVRKATAEKTLRLAWDGGATRADVYFYAKGPAKSQVVVNHLRLPDAAAGERQHAYWKEHLRRLKTHLEGDAAAPGAD